MIICCKRYMDSKKPGKEEIPQEINFKNEKRGNCKLTCGKVLHRIKELMSRLTHDLEVSFARQ